MTGVGWREWVGQVSAVGADGMAELGAAAPMLLSWLDFVRIELEGVEGCRDLVEGLLRGAVMAAGACRRGSIGGIRTS
jgi:hypothetical protein